MSTDHSLIEFIVAQVRNEFEKFIRELEQVPEAAVTWQPAPDVHSIGWHARHALEWQYASAHVMLGGHKAEEELYCLGWEDSLKCRRWRRILGRRWSRASPPRSCVTSPIA